MGRGGGGGGEHIVAKKKAAEKIKMGGQKTKYGINKETKEQALG